jgi:competence protein ComEA
VTTHESRVLLRTAVILLVAGAVRWGAEARRPSSPRVGEGSSLAVLDSAATALADEERRRSTPLSPGELLDPNRVEAVELDRLPGVGPSLARAIVDSREREGPFRTLADLVRVRGIGPATLERIEGHLSLGTVPVGVRATQRSDGQKSRVRLDRATAAELESLPGVGPVLARRIVGSRRSDGPFDRVEALLRVRGIGPALLERLRPHVRIREP